MGNQTAPMEFVLTDFSEEPILKVLSFVLFLFTYLVATVGNVMIILIIMHVPHLRTPMYFFILNLAILDVCYISTTVPNMLDNSLKQVKRISFGGCVVQMYFFLSMAATESFLLAAMSYDRYVAICNPLRYTVIMNWRLCLQLAATSWIIGFIYSSIHTASTFTLEFCRSNVIDHIFCDIPPLLNISCSNTKINEFLIFVVGAVLILPCFPLIVISYVYIVRAIMRIPSATGRKKTFSTCVSHLIAVSLFYLTGTSVYLRPASANSSFQQNKISAVFYSIFVPMVNPIIYSLRNKELKGAIKT
ncbi:olfactory receptor 5I1-like, partial [Xenopus laevis]|uniref:Olfactory receptor n=1 Tax=Xenopus laevis TaxID=8355 RepID=A0A8J1MJQ5_XENLA